MRKNTFTGHRRLFLCVSGAIILIALILQLCGAGLNLGIDFTGGSILEYSVGEDYDVNDVETVLASVGFEDAQVTKAAPSAASIALQNRIAAEAAQAVEEPAEVAEAAVEEAAEEAEETAEEAVEETAEAVEETEEVAEETAEEAVEETEEAVEEAVEEAPVQTAARLLSDDKSNVVADGLTDLQIRLRLADVSGDLRKTVTGAVEGVAPSAKLLSSRQLTYQSVSENGYDTDFAGGFALEYDMGGAFDADQVKEAITAAIDETTLSANRIDVQAFTPEGGAENSGLLVLADMDDVTSSVRSVLEREMSAKYPNFHFVSIDHVSAIAGRDLISNAVKALLIAFACMLVYIAIRFDPLSGLAALFALLHDVLIMLSFMVFFRKFFQANSPFIAAVLTIVGYSINNTIIIFDRIRENNKRPGFSDKPKMEIVEMSVSSTLARTINTTLTTMITLVCLYIFGVESIREFAFPLIVGMLAGTYSSVLLSGQIWAVWSEKFAGRKASKRAAN